MQEQGGLQTETSSLLTWLQQRGEMEAQGPHNQLLHSRQGAVYFVTHQKRRVSATCFKRLGSNT
jgi:hypothetical protein